ncbi:PAS domain S-box protein [Shewanella yunxiaonensis]|uniref:histidine kinase n=1 Tax=Shewanella yunxiaonensis TaxID=2829809 RepID=A0ABX7YWX6_9GAMM|nr:PAS domain S-box protein [Shewanella yunxiaonensis]QUN06983.1 PAS domain S-box protein [Shewanella yunxiaonensis]
MEKAGSPMMNDKTSTLINEDILEDNFKYLLQNIPIAYIVMDELSQFIGFNQAFLEMLGYSADELLGKPFHYLLNDKSEIENHLKTTFPRLMQDGFHTAIFSLRSKNNNVVHVKAHGFFGYLSDKKTKIAHGFLENFTAEHDASLAKLKLERESKNVLDVISEHVMYFSPNGNLEWSNNLSAPFSNLYCSREKKICGYEQHCLKCPVKYVLEFKKPFSTEVSVNKSVLQISAYPVFEKNDNLISIVQIVRDISERRNLENFVVRECNIERLNVGRDIHDGLGQELVSLNLLSRTLLNKVIDKNSAVYDLAAKIEENARRATSLLHSTIQGLSQVPDSPDGLKIALSNLVESISIAYTKSCAFICRHNIEIDDYLISTNLYYIASESLTNALKHSNCDEVVILLEQEGKIVTLSIKDNGTGFSSAEHRRSGNGLKIMQYRASIINANISVESDSNGTTITCKQMLGGQYE